MGEKLIAVWSAISAQMEFEVRVCYRNNIKPCIERGLDKSTFTQRVPFKTQPINYHVL